MLVPGSRAGVAVSGGADSVALLHLLKRLTAEYKTELVVLHVNHHLRGAESDGDENFVRSLAESLDLPFFVRQSYVGESNQEAEARQARREFFENCRKTHGLGRIALGHTRSDQAETVIHRFLRGSGLRGLAAMRFVTEEGFIRPLLSTSREEARVWASQEGLRWREDSSNADLRFVRNRLRLQTIPTLARDYNENLEAVLASTARLAQAEEDFWSQEVDRVCEGLEKRTRLGSIFRVGDIQNLHLAFRRRLIRRILSDTRFGMLQGIDFEHVEAILALCESSEGHDRVLVPGADALRSFDSLLITQPGRLASEPRGYSVPIGADQWYGLPFGTGQICVRRVKPDRPIYDKFKEDQEFGIERAPVNRTILNGSPLTVRNWEPGDVLHRAGHQSAEKIKKLFQEHRVLLWDRRHWPVLQCGGEIAWARSFGVAEKFSVAREESEEIELLYRPVECVQAQLL